MNGTRSKMAAAGRGRTRHLTELQVENKLLETEEIAKRSEQWNADMNGVINEQGQTLNGVVGKFEEVVGRLERVETALQLGDIDVPLMIDAVNTMVTGIMNGMEKMQRAKAAQANLIGLPSTSTVAKDKGKGKERENEEPSLIVGKKGKNKRALEIDDEEEDVADAGTQAGPSQKRRKRSEEAGPSSGV